jgi:hypothetical protein
MGALYNTIENARGLAMFSWMLVGEAVAFIAIPLTFPTYRQLAREEGEYGEKYLNEPGSRFHNPAKPSPNTEDFPDGIPRTEPPMFEKVFEAIFIPRALRTLR